MSSTRKFLFDTEFDVDVARRREERLAAESVAAKPPPPEPEEPPPPPEPVFKSADLLQAHEDGYADGFANGKAQAEAAMAARIAATLDRLADQIEYIVQSAAESAARQREGVIEIGAAIARKLLPDFARRQGTAEIESMIAACVSDLIDEPRLVIRLADADLDALSERIDAITARRGFAGKVVLLAEPTVAPGDCRIEWADGGAERDSARLWQDIDRAAARLLDPGLHPAGANHAPGHASGQSAPFAAAAPSTVIDS
ncbi:flagellar assembly protein FliH [Skermanella rosea]|uniref:FliH/SctL family protein n=1 Tax=Skermanella rosea TaxID=1817965 RepID=UPI001931B7CE|nr:FliH/SctL family protein [Skermanella rosea]UEM04236.1 flagellar assembly protein FliH [Skermanella rosea]